jgi:hypothetical protein
MVMTSSDLVGGYVSIAFRSNRSFSVRSICTTCDS